MRCRVPSSTVCHGIRTTEQFVCLLRGMFLLFNVTAYCRLSWCSPVFRSAALSVAEYDGVTWNVIDCPGALQKFLYYGAAILCLMFFWDRYCVLHRIVEHYGVFRNAADCHGVLPCLFSSVSVPNRNCIRSSLGFVCPFSRHL